MLNERGCVGASDWIIEIVSPGNVAHDTGSKFALYEENGVAEYWIVFPGEKSVAVYLLQDGQYQLRGEYYQPGLIPSATLPEVAVSWEEAFEGV